MHIVSDDDKADIIFVEKFFTARQPAYMRTGFDF